VRTYLLTLRTITPNLSLLRISLAISVVLTPLLTEEGLGVVKRA